MKRILFLLLVVPVAMLADPGSGPLAGLTPAEFRAAGLHKLSPEELATLEALLRRPAAAPVSSVSNQPVASLPQGEDAFGQEQKLFERVEVIQRVPRAISSRIKGEFNGWRGRTVFELENGQTWQQVAPGDFAVRLTNPVVHVEKGALGAFYLRVEGFGSRIKVKRVK